MPEGVGDVRGAASLELPDMRHFVHQSYSREGGGARDADGVPGCIRSSPDAQIRQDNLHRIQIDRITENAQQESSFLGIELAADSRKGFLPRDRESFYDRNTETNGLAHSYLQL